MFEIDTVIVWLQQNPDWVAYALFIAAFIESFAIIGIFIPGVVFLALISGMAASADIHLIQVLIIVFTASSMADLLSFFIGLKFSKRIDKIWPFIQNPDWLKKGRDFFKTYGVFGIILAKFIGPIRPLMPLTAGSLNMKFRSFLPVELFASLIWAPLYSLPGYFAGKAVFADINNFFLLLSILIAVVFTILLYMKLIKKSY
jgi:membrane protein DedA with SNARE-associated domain